MRQKATVDSASTASTALAATQIAVSRRRAIAFHDTADTATAAAASASGAAGTGELPQFPEPDAAAATTVHPPLSAVVGAPAANA